MRIVFQDARLALVRTERAGEVRLPVSVIRSLQNKLVFLEAAPDERSIRNWKSLRFEQLKGDRSGQCSIRLNEQWRLVFRFDNTDKPPTIVVLSVEDYH